jgi:hypothetical protein
MTCSSRRGSVVEESVMEDAGRAIEASVKTNHLVRDGYRPAAAKMKNVLRHCDGISQTKTPDFEVWRFC